MAFQDPETRQPVVQHVYVGRDIFYPPRMSEAPELQLDFRDGYRTSWQTSFGAIPGGIVVANMKKWTGDHCASDLSDTSGIFFSSRWVLIPAPSIMDIAPTVLSLLQVTPSGQLDGHALDVTITQASANKD